jgi:putative transposase
MINNITEVIKIDSSRELIQDFKITLVYRVTPLKGRRRMSGAMPRDSVEAQGLRIDIKYYEIL